MSIRGERERIVTQDSIILLHQKAIKSLGELSKPHPNSATRDEFINFILTNYSVSDIASLGFQEKYDLAMDHLTQDLLWQTFYNSKGKPTKYGLAYLGTYPNIDLNNYQYVGIEAISFLNKIANSLTAPNEDCSYSVVVERYVSKFIAKKGEPSLLVIPGVISIGENCISFTESSSFVPPYGGNSVQVTFYKHIWD